MTRLVLAPLLAATLGGCAESAEGSRAFVLAERDSAGIHVVELSGRVSRLVVRAGYLRRSGEGEYRDRFTLALVDEGGMVSEALGSYPGRELHFHRAPSGLTLATPPVFGRDTRVAGFAGRLVAGTTDRFAIDVYDRGTLQMRIVASVASAPATRSEVDAWLEDRRQRLADAPNEQLRELARRSIERAPVRETPPAFRRLMVDSERYIWIEEPYRVPNGPSRWIVLAADGTPAASVELSMKGPTSPATPPDLTIFEIGEDYILALRRDGQEVEQVVVYALERGEMEGPRRRCSGASSYAGTKVEVL